MPERDQRGASWHTLARGSRKLCLLLVLLPLLSGCLLVSGQTLTGDSTADGGNVYVDFVSAEGTDTHEVQTNFVERQLEVLVSARTERGQLRVEILDANDSVALVLDAQPSEQWRQGIVTTDGEGNFRYRVRATGAQRGTFQILYQPVDG